MRLDVPGGYRSALDGVERALRVRYPASAAESFGKLGRLMETPRFRSTFPDSRLLLTPDEVSAARERMPAELLPFMRQPPDFLAFDSTRGGSGRVVAWADHATVADWGSCDQLIEWLTEFVEKGTGYSDWAARHPPRRRTGPAGILSSIRTLLGRRPGR